MDLFAAREPLNLRKARNGVEADEVVDDQIRTGCGAQVGAVLGALIKEGVPLLQQAPNFF